MLETLDILIGFTVVMLVVSMAVTMITQAIGTGLSNLRGQCLKRGVSRLLHLMDQGLSLADAQRITDHVLRNPLVSEASIFGSRARNEFALATVIHREELIRLLLDFAVGGDAEKTNPNVLANEQELRNRFRASLANNGIVDPEAVLHSVRAAVVELEKTNPELSQSARVAIALVNFGASDFLAKFNTWFDQTMDRVSDLFTRQIRAITAIVALVLAFALQLDSIGLINRLSVDEALRNELVQTATREQENWRRRIEAQQARSGEAAPAQTGDAGNSAEAQGPAETDSNASSEADNAAAANVADAADAAAANVADAAGEEPAAANSATANVADAAPEDGQPQAATGQQRPAEARDMIEELGVVALPQNWTQWWQSWWVAKGGFRWSMLFGILLSAALLSLGAPFWYAALANLLRLRSVIARKDEEERTERQTTQQGPAAPAAPGGAPSSSLAGGERGDLAATG